MRIPGSPEYDAAALEALEAQADTIKAVFRDRGYASVEPPVLQPADVFLDRSGEDIRRRLYVFTDPGGQEVCLRPDLTIPTCRMYLGREPESGRQARLCYNGSAFRFQPRLSDKPVEFIQAGAECLGDEDREAADAEVIGLAADCLRAAGLREFDIALGDLGLFGDLVDALDMPARWRGRLKRHFWRPGYFRELLERLASEGAPQAADDARAGLLKALGAMDEAEARALVEDVIELAEIAPVGGRTTSEIAERFLEKATDASADVLSADVKAVIDGVLGVRGTPEKAVEEIGRLTAKAGVDLSASLDRMQRRLDAIAGAGLDLGKAAFSAEFGRNMEYYTGFVFELRVETLGPSRQIAGGGRYDGLLQSLGAPQPVPAVGCAIMTERLLEAVRRQAS